MPPENITTLEEARAEILRLNGELDKANTERENYTKRISTLETDLEKVREINQQYFLQLSQQYKPSTETETHAEDDVPSCEDFAKTLTI